MYDNYVFNNVSQALPALLDELLRKGDEVGSRAGRTLEMTHLGITLEEPWKREILVPHRLPSIAAQIAETMWVISGRDDMEFLSQYLPRAKDFSDDGKTWRAGYGKRLRAWPRRSGDYSDPIDQLRYVVDLLKEDPLSRQAVMTLWDPQVDTEPGKDIPCNDWITFSSRLGKLDMHVAIRSNDAMWGWSGINAFEWSSLLEIVAGLLGVQTGSLHFSVTSFHLYQQHWEKAGKIVNSSNVVTTQRIPKDSPRFDISDCNHLEDFDGLCERWFVIEEKIRNGDACRDEVDAFPEPMLRSWLRIIQWWWTGQQRWLEPLAKTALEEAAFMSVKPPNRDVPLDLPAPEGSSVAGMFTAIQEGRETQADLSDFIQFAIRTHNEKHAAYGDSWKRRGEMLGILANIARKIDRLGGSETSDETSADTAMDLMVYLAKYRVWLGETLYHDYVASASDLPDAANALLWEAERVVLGSSEDWTREDLEEALRRNFDLLEQAVQEKYSARHRMVSVMLADAYRLGRLLWDAAQGGTDEYRGADAD